MCSENSSWIFLLFSYTGISVYTINFTKYLVMINQTFSRVNFSYSQWELQYLFKYASQEYHGITIINHNNNCILAPHYKIWPDKWIRRVEKVDLAFEFIAFWLKDTLFLKWLTNLLNSGINSTIVTSPSLSEDNILKEKLEIELKKMKKTLKKRMFQIPLYACSFVFIDSINQLVPWFFPVVSLLTLKSMFSLPSKYRKEIKKINDLILRLDSLKLNIKVEPQLEYVEQSLKKKNFRQAIRITDDLDWVINQEEFSNEMLTLAEYIEILERKWSKSDTIKNRSLNIFSYTFYSKIFYKLAIR